MRYHVRFGDERLVTSMCIIRLVGGGIAGNNALLTRSGSGLGGCLLRLCNVIMRRCNYRLKSGGLQSGVQSILKLKSPLTRTDLGAYNLGQNSQGRSHGCPKRTPMERPMARLMGRPMGRPLGRPMGIPMTISMGSPMGIPMTISLGRPWELPCDVPWDVPWAFP